MADERRMHEVLSRVPYTVIPDVADVQHVYREGVVRCARSYIGVREQGQNRGPVIERWLRAARGDAGMPYCAAAACAWHAEGAPMGYVTSLPRFLSASKIYRWALRNPGLADVLHVFGAPRDERIFCWSNVLPGDIFVMGSTVDKARRIAKGGLASGHCGVAAGLFHLDVGHLPTIEGNTDTSGSREGQGVYGPPDASREPDEPRIVGFVRPRAIRGWA